MAQVTTPLTLAERGKLWKKVLPSWKNDITNILDG